MAGSDLVLPLTVDAFTLDRRIGAGAMGEVYHAVEAISGREVAVKVMARHLMGNQRAEARFRREISAMGQLRHEGIPAFAGWGDLPGGRPYLAMDFIKGHPLDAFISPERPIPEDLALWVAMKLADVIGHCHRESGMIHRDLKPGNVMVDLAGLPGLCERSLLRILDFGLATYIDFGDFEDFSVGARGYAGGGTVIGEVLGTPAYMSPEQIRGEALTFHSDIYAIGAILCHLLTGRLPYEGPSVGVVMARHLDAPVPDPSQIVAVRPATVAVVQRAMAKNPQARYRSYQQFTAALQAARYVTVQATRRIARPETHLPGERREVPTTRGTEEPLERPPSAGPIPALPAVPTPPGSSGTASWKRPAVAASPTAAAGRHPALNPADPAAAAPPTAGGTSAWRRPVRTPPPAGAEPPAAGTSAWKRPAAAPPPEPQHEPTPAPPSQSATSGWHRPVDDPAPPSAAATGDAPQGTGSDHLPVHQPPTTSRWRRPVRTPPPPQDGDGAAP